MSYRCSVQKNKSKYQLLTVALLGLFIFFIYFSLVTALPNDANNRIDFTYSASPVNYSTVNVNNSQFLQDKTPQQIANLFDASGYYLKSNPFGFYNVTTLPVSSQYWNQTGDILKPTNTSKRILIGGAVDDTIANLQTTGATNFIVGGTDMASGNWYKIWSDPTDAFGGVYPRLSTTSAISINDGGLFLQSKDPGAGLVNAQLNFVDAGFSYNSIIQQEEATGNLLMSAASGRILIAGATDDTTSALQVAGTTKTNGFTLQDPSTTANINVTYETSAAVGEQIAILNLASESGGKYAAMRSYLFVLGDLADSPSVYISSEDGINYATFGLSTLGTTDLLSSDDFTINVGGTGQITFWGNSDPIDIYRSTNIRGDLLLGYASDDIDRKITFAAQTNTGIITWMEDENQFRFSNDMNATNNLYVAKNITIGEKVKSTGNVPTVSSCGATPLISGNDISGNVTVGTGVITACTVSFNKSYSKAPHCFINERSSVVFGGATPTPTGFTVAFSASLGGGQFDYWCIE